MGGDLRWQDNMSGSLRTILAKSQHMQDDLAHGAKVILADSQARVPVESGELKATGRINRDRGGKNTVAIMYGTAWARYIHEHMFFKHPHGGSAKFLELAMLLKGEEAINEAGDRFWRRIGT